MSAAAAELRRLELEDFGEDFEVYGSGAAVTLFCLKCQASKAVIGTNRLAAFVDEAASHAETCPGRGVPARAYTPANLSEFCHCGHQRGVHYQDGSEQGGGCDAPAIGDAPVRCRCKGFAPGLQPGRGA